MCALVWLYATYVSVLYLSVYCEPQNHIIRFVVDIIISTYIL